MLKRFLVLIVLLITVLLCAVWAPWQSINIDLLQLVGIGARPTYARIQLTSLSGELELLIDGETRGSVGPEGSPLILEDIAPGEHQVLLRRTGNSNYHTLERLITFSADTDVVIAYELGPSAAFSGGHILTAAKSISEGSDVILNLRSLPGEANVKLNSVEIGTTPIRRYKLDYNNTNEISVTKPGYEEIKLNLLPGEQAAREKLRGYELNLETDLFLLPIDVIVS